MADKDNHIDEYIKEEVAGMNFEFKDVYWTEMEGMLNQSKKRRGVLFWWMSGVSVVLLILGVALYNNHVVNQNANRKVASEGEGIEDNKLRFQVDEISSSAEFLDGTTNFRNADSNTTLETQEASSTKTDDSINSTATSNELLTVQSDRLYASNTSSLQTKYQEEIQSAYKTKANNETTSAFENTVTDNYENKQSTQISESKDVVVNSLPVRFPSIDLEHRNNVNTVELSKRPKSLNSFVEIDGGIGYGLNGASNSEIGRGMNGRLGLIFNLEYKRFVLKTGLGFGVSGINGYGFIEEKRVYGFASEIAINEIDYNQLFIANIPLNIGYSGLKHSFSAGVKLNFMLSANGRVNTWDSSVNNVNEWGYSNGLNDVWMSAGIDYFYRFSRRWSVGLEIDMDITKRGESYYKEQHQKLQMWQVGIGLKYRLN